MKRQNLKKISYLFFLITLLFGLSFASDVFGAYELSDGLVRYLNHGDGTDETGNFSPLGTGLSSVEGKFGAGIGYNGTNSKLEVSTSTPTWSSVMGRSDYVKFSIGAWIYITDPGQQAIFSQGYQDACSSPYSAWRIGVEADNKPRFGAGSSVADEMVITATDAISEDAWHFIVGTWNNTSDVMYLYVDGTEVASSTFTGKEIYVKNVGTYEGYLDECGNYFEGRIDETFFYEYDLTADQISDLWNSGTGQEICITEGCAYEFEGYDIEITNIESGGYQILPQFLVVSTTSPLPRPYTLRHLLYYTTSTIASSTYTEYYPINSQLQPFIASYNIPDLATSSPDFHTWWIVYAMLYDVNTNQIKASTSVAFWFENFAATSTRWSIDDLFEYENCNDTLIASSTWGELVCHTRNIGRAIGWIFIKPHGPTNEYIGDAFNNFSETFPFVFVFGTANKIQEYISNSTTTSPGTTDISLIIPAYRNNPSSTFVIFSSSSMITGFGQDLYNAWSNFVLIGLGTLMIIALIMMTGI